MPQRILTSFSTHIWQLEQPLFVHVYNFTPSLNSLYSDNYILTEWLTFPEGKAFLEKGKTQSERFSNVVSPIIVEVSLSEPHTHRWLQISEGTWAREAAQQPINPREVRKKLFWKAGGAFVVSCYISFSTSLYIYFTYSSLISMVAN